ncbi:MAG: PEGA domain-containing protein [Methanoregula sp.]
MCSKKVPVLIGGLLLLVVLIVCIVPVSGQSGSMSISYRGDGSYYIGDSILLDGTNNVGNTTVIVLTGPGLPADGVPPYAPTGVAGTGDTIHTDPSGTWNFIWDTGRTVGASQLYTSRYTLTVYDLSNPAINSSASIFLRQPGFYATVTPNPAVLNNYVQLTGNVESATNTIEIKITDAHGNLMHTYDAPVSANGYFQFGFHVDMSPGTYSITFSSPTLPNSLTEMLTIVASNANLTTSTIMPSQTTVTGAPATPQITPPTVPSGASLVISSTPLGASVYVDSILDGTTPVTLNGVAPGTHNINIKAPGYLTVSMDVVIADNKTTDVSPVMVKAPFGMALSPLIAIAGVFGALLITAVKRKKN